MGYVFFVLRVALLGVMRCFFVLMCDALLRCGVKLMLSHVLMCGVVLM